MSVKNVHRSAPLIDRYASGGAILAYAFFGLTPAQETARIGPGPWSLAELAGHLLDADLIFSERMKRVLAEDEPAFQPFDKDAWIERLSYPSMPVVEAVDLLAANRRWTARLLRLRPDADFGRAGRHPELGRVTLAGLLATATNHVDHHLRSIYAKRAGLGVAIPPRYGSEALQV